MRMRSLFSLRKPFSIFYWLSRKIRRIFVHFYKCFKAISSFHFIQILFIYKWYARKINVSFLAFDITIQYGWNDYSGTQETKSIELFVQKETETLTRTIKFHCWMLTSQTHYKGGTFNIRCFSLFWGLTTNSCS